MAKAWKDVIASQQYQSLNPQQQAEAQAEYFDTVVAPKVSGDDWAAARDAFYSAYPSAGGTQETQQQPQASGQQQNIQQPQQQGGILSDLAEGAKESGRALLSAATSVANIPASITDAIVGAGAGVGKMIGLGDGSYPTAPRVTTQGLEQDFGLAPGTLTPNSTAGKVMAEALPYLTPVGVERAAAAAPSLAGRLAEGTSRLLAENAIGSLAANSNKNDAGALATDLGTGVAVGGAINQLGRLAGTAYRSIGGALNSADDVSRLAKSAEGRRYISDQAGSVSDDISRAADAAGVDINSLTPGMRSGNRGVAQAEGILASKPGVAQDAHSRAFGEIQNKFNSAMDDFGALAGNASEKSAVIKQRVLSGIDSMKATEKNAWDNVRSTMPESRGRMANTNATIRGDIDAGMPLTPEMKQFVAAYSKSGKGITFDAMKAWRGKLADAEQKYIRSGESNMARRMGELRDAATEDMRSMAQNGGFLDQWTAANDLSKARFAAQKQAETALGKDLATDSLVTNGVKSLQNSAKSGTGDFNRMIGSLPESERTTAIASILQDAMSQGVRGGKSEGAGISHIASILTPQNVAAISKHSPELGKLAAAYGELSRAATKPLRYIENTGRSVPAIASLEQGLPKAAQVVLNAVGNSTSGAIVGTTGGGFAGGVVGAVAGSVAKGAIERIAASRSGRYAIERAIQEAAKGVRAGGSQSAMAAAEKRFMSNKVAVKAIRDALGNEDFQRLARAGIVSSLSGMESDQ